MNSTPRTVVLSDDVFGGFTIKHVPVSLSDSEVIQYSLNKLKLHLVKYQFHHLLNTLVQKYFHIHDVDERKNIVYVCGGDCLNQKKINLVN